MRGGQSNGRLKAGQVTEGGLSAVTSGKEATEAVLFSDTSELSWATSHEQGATESWDLLGLQAWLSGGS